MDNELVDLVEHIKTSGRRILVIGLGESGCGVLEFLSKNGIAALGVEKSSEEQFLKNSSSYNRITSLKQKGVPVFFGIDSQDPGSLFDEASLAVLSPGVPVESAVAGMLRRKDIKIVAEMDFALAYLRAYHPDSTLTLIAGSQGKSTTLSLICHFLQQSDLEFTALGHNNTPFISELLSGSDHSRGRRFIVETSAYQLESSLYLRPEIAVLLNLSSKHLERFGNMHRFSNVLGRVFSVQQPDHHTLFNGDDPEITLLASTFNSIRGRFGSQHYEDEISATVCHSPESFSDDILVKVSGAEEKYDLRLLRLPGLYNRYNAAAAILTSRLLGVPRGCIQEALFSYCPLEHRMEISSLPDGRVAVNDSKSTTVAATCCSLESAVQLWPASRIAVLLGGRAGACEWSPLVKFLTQHGARNRITPILFGEDRKLIASHLGAWDIGSVLEETFVEAVGRAYRSSCEVILLSPACSSFDEFKNFEQRGRQFKDLIFQLAGTA